MTTEIARRIENLIAQMTLSEKLGQLTMLAASLVETGPPGPHNPATMVREGRAGSILNTWGAKEIREAQRVALEETRLKIPLFFAVDILHGHRTIYPIPLAEACAFDRALWLRTAQEAAEEATRDGIQMTFAPMLDVSRDPRWGRICECAGEDAFINAEYAKAKVIGFQDAPPRPEHRLAAVAKHFVAYGAVTAGRDYAEVDVSQRALHEIYLPPFQAAVEAGVMGIMPSFTDIAGVAMTAHKPLLHDLLRKRWGFEGVIISDYNAIAELIPHGVAADLTDAATQALKAGVDIDMMAGAYEQGLPVALERGDVSMDEIDRAVRRVLKLKFALGLFDNPLRGLEDVSPTPDSDPSRRASARDAARRSIVLLQNRDAFLPWSQAPQRIAVVGPLADTPSELMGAWCMAGEIDETVGILGGMRTGFAGSTITHAAGGDFEATDAQAIADAVAVAQAADAVVLCIGESRHISGEAASRTRPAPPDSQLELARAILATGKPVLLVLVGGRPFILPQWLVDGAQAIIAAWFPGTEGGNAITDIIKGVWNPSARLSISWPVAVGQIPIHYGLRTTGRPHDPKNGFSTGFLDAPITPRWSFGEGLSYTTYELGEARASAPILDRDGAIEVSLDITNAGKKDGETTLFLFIRDPVAQVTRPALELKDFQNVVLAAGESKRATFTLRASQLSYPDMEMKPRLDSGRIEIHVGTSARACDLKRLDIEVRA
ncbi:MULTISPECIES: glycoside hydrolase family 3 N-terminal domain-containing protein [unclassified Beijerinckia]|uniref:glycoside hydrolase family 3 N-terminal domain-containing protein n=1 Tax=unclassified Beijerinckia TaxID=2638183 RepID=UPI0008984B1C|nr:MULTISPECIES: glycoside hydrolase family 3 N-terminal domain-containing protein [unclassified Beijerinckia]MDH7797035.1 beta-glucosidase [Beijerinckia sp. GAS462]SEC69547.1 beta-glucosidase [Beijerinckia sp. 28-YEA-48]